MVTWASDFVPPSRAEARVSELTHLLRAEQQARELETVACDAAYHAEAAALEAALELEAELETVRRDAQAAAAQHAAGFAGAWLRCCLPRPPPPPPRAPRVPMRLL